MTTTRPASLVLPQDENKSNLAGKVLVSKTTKQQQPLAVRRSVLGDISNKTSTLVPKVEQKPSGMGRVPIFASSSTVPHPQQPQTFKAPSLSLKSLSDVGNLLLRPSTSVSVVPTTSISTSSSSTIISSSIPSLPPQLPHILAPTLAPPPRRVEEVAIIDAKPMDIDNDEEDIDIHDLHDPQCCTEYVEEIFDYCREKEAKDQVMAGYMSRQVDINEKMRAILIDWMVEVHVKFKLLTETMFLAVSLIDRFLAQKPVSRSKLQLVGITALFVSAKYEEVRPPEVRDFVHISDNAFPREEIFKMERLLLTSLDFNLSSPTPLHFLRRFSKAAKSDSRTHTLSKYLTELTLAEYRMIDFVPSLIAAAAVYLARRMTCRPVYWTTTLEKYTTYSEDEIMECALALNAIIKKSEKSSLKAVRKKYLSSRLLEVARIPPAEF